MIYDFQLFQDLLCMILGVHFGDYSFDNPVCVNDESGSNDSHVGSSV